MNNKLKSVRTLAATLITFGSLAGGANAAITIDINRASGAVVVSGQLTLFDVTGTSNTKEFRLPDADGNWNYGTYGSGAVSAPPSTNPTLQFSFPSGSVTWSIMDVSNSNTQLLSGALEELSLWVSPSLIGALEGSLDSGAYDSSVDAGDLFSVNGGFTATPAQITQLSILPDGAHAVPYNGDQLILNLTSIPEPSSALLLGLGALSLGARRRRTN